MSAVVMKTILKKFSGIKHFDIGGKSILKQDFQGYRKCPYLLHEWVFTLTYTMHNHQLLTAHKGRPLNMSRLIGMNMTKVLFMCHKYYLQNNMIIFAF